MIITPMIRGSVCLNAHPVGCAKETERQIAYSKSTKYTQAQNVKRNIDRQFPRAALILGCSTGYGLASRITAAFGYGAATIGVSFEREPGEKKSATPGWYNNAAFDRAAKTAGLRAVTLNGDAFSDDTRQKVVAEAKKLGVTFDLVVYSLASGVRVDPDTGEKYISALKPIGAPYSGTTIDAITGEFSALTAEPATAQEIAHTVKVMGGEDWERWIAQLTDAGALSQSCITVAYSYIGPALSYPLYRDGTIGEAKKHLEKTAHVIDARLAQNLNGRAFVSVNKGVATRSSAVIPTVPLYLSVLFKVMKENGTHESCIEQINRLFAERLYRAQNLSAAIPVDHEGLIRIDEFEMDKAVQAEVARRLECINENNLSQLADLAGYRHDFLAANGFDVVGVDYAADIPRMDCV